jgi:hypothetical protein
MNWLKKNAALVVGVGLPLLLVFLFALASWIPKMMVEPPKYDVVFLTGYYDNINGVQFNIGSDKRVKFFYRGINYGNWPKLYRYSPSTGATQEISIDVPESLPKQNYQSNPPQEDATRRTDLSVPEVEGLTFSTTNLAPDGYEFRASRGGRGAGIMGELFFSSRYNDMPVLVKSGHIVKIPSLDNNGYYYNTKLVGWVVP